MFPELSRPNPAVRLDALLPVCERRRRGSPNQSSPTEKYHSFGVSCSYGQRASINTYRFIAPDVAHHNTQRGADGQSVFSSRCDGLTYLRLLREQAAFSARSGQPFGNRAFGAEMHGQRAVLWAKVYGEPAPARVAEVLRTRSWRRRRQCDRRWRRSVDCWSVLPGNRCG